MGQAGSQGPVDVLSPRPDQHGFCSWAHRVWLSSGDDSLPIRKEYEPHPSLCAHTEGPAASAAHLKMAVWTVIFLSEMLLPWQRQAYHMLGVSGPLLSGFWGSQRASTPKTCAAETLNRHLSTVLFVPLLSCD